MLLSCYCRHCALLSGSKGLHVNGDPICLNVIAAICELNNEEVGAAVLLAKNRSCQVT